VSEQPAPVAAPVVPQFFCGQHGGTNQVIGLGRATYCLECVTEAVELSLNPVFRMSELTK